MHFAYNEITGNVRLEASFRWEDAGWNDWTRGGVMLRETLYSGSKNYNTLIRKGPGNPWEVYGKSGDGIFFQGREGTDWGSGMWGQTWPGMDSDKKIAIQRIDMGFGGFDVVQSLYDIGGGWQLLGQKAGYIMPDDLLVGIALTAGDNGQMHQFIASDVEYSQGELLGWDIPVVPEDGEQGPCYGTPGFLIHSGKPHPDLGNPGDWLGYAALGPLFETPGLLVEEGYRIEEFVNLHDSAGRGRFGDDQSFPGIDAFEQPTGDPADSDDDNYFVTEVKGCIELTAGRHLFCINSDDGVQMWIGGVFVGQTPEWKGTSDEYLFVDVAVGGVYTLLMRHLEGGGGAAFEAMEVLPDGTHVLMNDVANGASPVYVPEPATIALLGFGGLAMLRVRKRS
jgi:hypothetical protein